MTRRHAEGRELSAPALEMARRAMDAARGRPFLEALERTEDIYLNELMKTEDAQEGVQAFMEKRKPDFTRSGSGR